jgi:hypothetical protein
MMPLAKFRSLTLTNQIGRAAVACLLGLLLTAAASAPAAAQDVLDAATIDGGETVFSPVLAYEWNTDGDFLGWTPNGQVTDPKVEAGAMSGVSGGNDPFFSSPGGLGLVIGGNIDSGEVNRIQVATQFGSGSPLVRADIFFFASSGPFGRQPLSPGTFPTMTDGNLHVYTLDFDSSSPLWGRTVNSIRLDPVADRPGDVEAFSYDYFRAGSQFDPAEFKPGDVNNDTFVDAADFEIIRANFFGINVGRSNGDLNRDGVVNLADYGQWKDNFPSSAAPFLAQLVGVVPEPASCLLALVGLTAMGGARRRRR